eukprot:TRINITY_DN906_c0_g3_i1.p1 TRINITY_DN906_c0_g3~~TRINITY_DN906_c0_g3_i1.p1  ORF type:complete len:386 (-),score=87.88 TRINITY_DN906_c0_g3_i1:476-1603(-)
MFWCRCLYYCVLIFVLFSFGAVSSSIVAVNNEPKTKTSAAVDVDLHWIMIDISKNGNYGDSHVLVDPAMHKLVLIDTGPPWPVEAELVMNSLVTIFTRYGFSQPYPIDTIIITHPHGDHFGGLPYILKNSKFKVGQIFWHDYDRIKSHCLEIILCISLTESIKLAKEKSIPIRGYGTVPFPPILFSGGVQLQPLGFFYFEDCPQMTSSPPFLSSSSSSSSLSSKSKATCRINNLSFVTRLNFGVQNGNLSVLLTGDQEQAESLWMLNHYAADILRSELIKAPHHLNGLFENSDPKWFYGVAPKYIISSTDKKQWCDARASTTHDLLKNLTSTYSTQTFITLMHGEIDVHFSSSTNGGVKYTVTPQKEADIWSFKC